MAAGSTSLMELLTKEEKDALLEKRMEEIRRKNKEREERHKEIVADKKQAEDQKAAISSGASEYIRHSKDAHFPAGADDSQVAGEITRRDDNWEATKYREEWPERDEGDEPQYWQQSRQRGSRDAAVGQWTRGGGGRHAVSSWQSPPNERSADGRGRPSGRGGRQAVRPDHSQYADADSCNFAGSAFPASFNLVSPTVTKDEPTDHRPEAQTSNGKTAAKEGSTLPSTAASATASYAHNTDVTTGRGTGRGRGRGIVPTSDQVKQEQLLREAERPAAPGGLQSLGQQQQLQPSAEPARHSPPVKQTTTPSKSIQHPQGPSKKDQNYQNFESARPDAVGGRQQLVDQPRKQPSEHDGHQEQPSHHQQSYEETRRRNAAAYEESLRTNPGSAGGGFLADRHRDVQTDYSKTNEEIRQYRQQQLSSENQVMSPVRHQRNFGGASADLEQVKNKVKEVAHVKQDASYRGRPPAEQSLELRMTGHERQQYAAWREEQRRADEARIERSRRPGDGGWRRQWDSEKGSAPGEESAAAAQHGDRNTGGPAPPRNAGTRRVGSGRTGAGARLDDRRSPDHGGDRAAVQAKEQRSPFSKGREQPAAASDSSAENAKRGDRGRQRRNRENRENPRPEKDPSEPERARRGNITHGGAGDASTAVIAGMPQHVQQGAARQLPAGEPLATGDRQHALPAQHTAPTGKSDSSLKTQATAEDSREATKQDNQPQQQAGIGDAGSAAADSPSAPGSDQEWEDVDDDVEDDDDEEYDPEEGGGGGRRVVDWAAEVENEYGSS